MSNSSVITSFLALSLVLTSVTCARTRTTTQRSHGQNFNPLVEALLPRGFRVSIPDLEGIQLFAFHGKINEPIPHLDAGTYSKDISSSKDGRWTFRDNDVQLQAGDVINYWLFVQRYGKGYRVDGLSAVISEFVPVDDDPKKGSSAHYMPTLCDWRLPSTPPPPIDYNHTPPPPRTQSESCDCNKNQLNEISSQLNATLMQVKALHDKMEPINSQVESLKELLQELTKNMDIGTQLLLVGRQPPDGNSLEAIRNLITDKLELFDLEEKIQHAQRQSNGILFEMSSSVEKKRILFRAEQRLKTSNYKIIDPQNDDSIKGGSYNLDERIKE